MIELSFALFCVSSFTTTKMKQSTLVKYKATF
jgi:hypothetical protein